MQQIAVCYWFINYGFFVDVVRRPLSNGQFGNKGFDPTQQNIAREMEIHYRSVFRPMFMSTLVKQLLSVICHQTAISIVPNFLFSHWRCRNSHRPPTTIKNSLQLICWTWEQRSTASIVTFYYRTTLFIARYTLPHKMSVRHDQGCRPIVVPELGGAPFQQIQIYDYTAGHDPELA